MRFPFVILPRSAYDDMRERERTLFDTLLRLRIPGAAASALAPDALSPRLEAKELSPIERAVNENPHARANPRLRAHLLSWARKELDAADPNDRAAREALERKVLNRLRGWSVVSTESSSDEDEDDEVIALG